MILSDTRCLIFSQATQHFHGVELPPASPPPAPLGYGNRCASWADGGLTAIRFALTAQRFRSFSGCAPLMLVPAT